MIFHRWWLRTKQHYGQRLPCLRQANVRPSVREGVYHRASSSVAITRSRQVLWVNWRAVRILNAEWQPMDNEGEQSGNTSSGWSRNRKIVSYKHMFALSGAFEKTWMSKDELFLTDDTTGNARPFHAFICQTIEGSLYTDLKQVKINWVCFPAFCGHLTGMVIEQDQRIGWIGDQGRQSNKRSRLTHRM